MHNPLNGPNAQNIVLTGKGLYQFFTQNAMVLFLYSDSLLAQNVMGPLLAARSLY
jgi:hypothetical protein